MLAAHEKQYLDMLLRFELLQPRTGQTHDPLFGRYDLSQTLPLIQ